MTQRLSTIAVALIVGHAAILYGHHIAHGRLGVDLALWQEIYAYSVIVVAPLIAAALFTSGRRRFGFGLLAVSMMGSLLFGVYHHYIVISSDHVAHLPPGPESAQLLFRATALAMAVVELAGFCLGWTGRRRASQSTT